MKKICLLFFAIVLCFSTYGQYVDLGLPSGTEWMDTNEEGLYNYDDAVKKFGDRLPTKEQFFELKDKCKWTWNGNGYKVTGPNGKSIHLPAAGSLDCDGNVYYVGSRGYYWSSTPDLSKYAWNLDFDSYNVYIGSIFPRCYGQSVRLVRIQPL